MTHDKPMANYGADKIITSAFIILGAKSHSNSTTSPSVSWRQKETTQKNKTLFLIHIYFYSCYIEGLQVLSYSGNNLVQSNRLKPMVSIPHIRYTLGCFRTIGEEGKKRGRCQLQLFINTHSMKSVSMAEIYKSSAGSCEQCVISYCYSMCLAWMQNRICPATSGNYATTPGICAATPGICAS